MNFTVPHLKEMQTTALTIEHLLEIKRELDTMRGPYVEMQVHDQLELNRLGRMIAPAESQFGALTLGALMGIPLVVKPHVPEGVVVIVSWESGEKGKGWPEVRMLRW